MSKSESKNSSSPHRHFIEHLADVSKKPPRKSHKNEENSSLLIRWLREYRSPTTRILTKSGTTIDSNEPSQWEMMQETAMAENEFTGADPARISINRNKTRTAGFG
jgi:hypothetical protein